MEIVNKLKSIISYIKNPKLYIIVGIVVVIILALIIILNRKEYKFLKKISIPMLIVSIVFLSLKLFLTNTAINLLNRANDKTVEIIVKPFITSLFDSLFTYGLILFGIGLVMIIIYFVLRKRSKK